MLFSFRLVKLVALALAAVSAIACGDHLTAQSLGVPVQLSQAQADTVALSVKALTRTLTFSPAKNSIEVVQGTKGTDVFSFTSGGSFLGSPALTISGLPTGVTASWSSNPVAMTGNKGTSTLTLEPKVSVIARNYTFTVTASAAGLRVAHSYTLTIKPTAGIQVQIPQAIAMYSMGTASRTISATFLPGVSVASGAAGCSASLVSTLPIGITATWSKPSTAVAGKVQWTMTLTGSPLAVGWVGQRIFSVRITDAGSGRVFTASQYFSLAVKFVPPILSVSPADALVYVGQGASARDVFTFKGGGSFHGGIALSVSGLPSGMSYSWSQNPVSLNANTGSSVLILVATPALPAGQYSFTVLATGNGLHVYTYLRATVVSSAGVTLAVAHPSLTVIPGVAATMAITATALNSVTFAADGTGIRVQVTSQLPDGVSAQWSQPSISGSGKVITWTLTMNATADALGGLQPVAVSAIVKDKASSMTFSANQQFSLIISVLAQVSIGTSPGTTIPADFMGLSQEWGNTYRFMGSNAVGVNQTYRQLLMNLTAYGSAPVNIRMGGNSTDLSDMPSADTDTPLADLATALHTPFIIGVNLGSNDLSIAVAQVQNDLSQMPSGSIEAVEIGNEPDSYYRNGMRPSTYTFEDYVSDFDTWKSSIDPLLPSGVKLAGPAWASTTSLSDLPAFLGAEAPSLSMVTQHFYAGSPDSKPTDYLLLPNVATDGPRAVASAVGQAHTNGLKFRIGELGSFYGVGIPGISDAFGSGLWAIDTMFEFANAGVDGVNWETSTGNYDHPFFFETTRTGTVTSYKLTSVSPLYYGMLLFQQATANGSSLLPVTVNTTANLKCWPTVDSNGTTRLTILNKDESQSGTVMVTLPGYTEATVTRLRAPSFKSTTGVTLGGQTFDTSVDGKIQGTPETETVQGNNGVFAIPMPITSAALVVFSN